MRWITCPMCHGAKGQVQLPGFTVSIAFAENNPDLMDGQQFPCPTCDPGDGKPTGRICVMSEGELNEISIAFMMRIPLVKNETLAADTWQDIEAELAHRRKP